ncbi:MAG: transcription antitermination factor NusB [Ruminococcus sp.]|nr:transcription antitermination factor NusB [Ruminococcus sp.]
MAATRRSIRESAFILSFEMLFRDDSIDEIFEAAAALEDMVLNDEVKALVEGINEKKDELDREISALSNKRSIERIPRINLAVLRLAIYEALYDDKVPMNVAISEAVKLAEKYAFETDVSFVNGILGSFARSREKADE